MRIPNNDTLAIIVDVQETYFPFVYQHYQLEENLVKLIKGLQILRVPLVAAQQATENSGQTISPITQLFSAFKPIEKLTFSCYCDPDFVDILDSCGRNHVLLMGIEAHIGILQTALDLLSTGYQPVIVEDCISSRKPNDEQIAVERMRQEGAVITTSESILFELGIRAGSKQFQDVSQLMR